MNVGFIISWIVVGIIVSLPLLGHARRENAIIFRSRLRPMAFLTLCSWAFTFVAFGAHVVLQDLWWFIGWIWGVAITVVCVGHLYVLDGGVIAVWTVLGILSHEDAVSRISGGHLGILRIMFWVIAATVLSLPLLVSVVFMSLR